MKRYLFFLINMFLLLLIACSDTTLPKEMPEDFEFRLKYGYDAKNQLNTFDDTFTKDLIEHGQVEVDLQLTEAELVEVYDHLVTNKILKEAETGGYTNCEPYQTFRLLVQANGETFEHSWKDDECGGDNGTKALRQFVAFVVNIIEKKEEYQQLPDAVGGYE